MPAYDHDHENDVVYFARTNYRNQMRKFGIKTDDRRRHMYVIGKTGMGKTTMLENMFLADVYAGHGCSYVDPHGDTAEKLVNYIPEWRLKDVVYFNPADFDYPMGFNILENSDPNTRHVIASGLMGVFKKIWPDVWSARMEHILNNCLMTLLENPGNTLLGINRILVDRDFRVKMVSGLKDPVVKAFWITEFEQWEPKFRTEAIAPIQNKVGQFLSTSVVRNIVAQQKSTIKVREFMDTSKIFIVNLSKGRIGEEAMRLLGGMLITKMQLSVMERVDMPEIERRDFYLYIDEFQNFATESFASILSEARKYRLALILAHQYIEQLEEEVRDAVFGNVGTICTFRVGSPDAMYMENEFMPRFTPEDLVNLAKFEIYLRLMIDGVASEAFSALTLPPIAQKTGSMDAAIEFSRAHYGRQKPVVEAEIMRWSEMGGDDEEAVATPAQAALSSTAGSAEVEKAFQEAEEKSKAKKKFGGRPFHEYNCSRCNKYMALPVELDRSRPIYCEDCIEIVREERKGGKKQGEARAEKKPPAPRMKDGEVIVQEPSATIGLSALSKEKKPVEPKKEAPAAPTGVDFLSVELGPKVEAPAAVPAPKPAPAPAPKPTPALPPPAAGTTPTAPAAPRPEGERRNRRRGGKGRGGGGGSRPANTSAPAPQRPDAPKSAPTPTPTPPTAKPKPAPSAGGGDVFPW